MMENPCHINKSVLSQTMWLLSRMNNGLWVSLVVVVTAYTVWGQKVSILIKRWKCSHVQSLCMRGHCLLRLIATLMMQFSTYWLIIAGRYGFLSLKWDLIFLFHYRNFILDSWTSWLSISTLLLRTDIPQTTSFLMLKNYRHDDRMFIESAKFSKVYSLWHKALNFLNDFLAIVFTLTIPYANSQL